MARRGTGTEIEVAISDKASAQINDIAEAVAAAAKKVEASDDKLATSAEQARAAKRRQLTTSQKLKNAMLREAAAGDPLQEQIHDLGVEYQKAMRMARAFIVEGEKIPPGLMAQAHAAKKMQDELKDLANQQDETGEKKITLRERVQKLSFSYKAMAATVTASTIALGYAAAKAVTDTAELGDRVAKTARRMGISVEAYQAFDHAMNVSGTSMQEQGEALAKLARKIRDAAEGTGTGVDAFARLGVQVRNTAGQVKTSEQVFLDVAQAFHELPDGVDKAAISMDLFEESGTKLIEFLNLGSEGIENLRDEAEELGIMLSEDDTSAAETFTDALDRLMKSGRGIKTSFGTEIMPAMTVLADFLTGLIQKFKASQGAMQRFVVHSISLASDLAIGFLSAFTHIDNGIQGLSFLWSRFLKMSADALSDFFGMMANVGSNFGDMLAAFGLVDENPFERWSTGLNEFSAEQEQAMNDAGNRIVDNNARLAEAKVAVTQLKNAMIDAVQAERETKEAVDETGDARRRDFLESKKQEDERKRAAEKRAKDAKKAAKDELKRIKLSEKTFKEEKRKEEKRIKLAEQLAKKEEQAHQKRIRESEQIIAKYTGPVADAFGQLGANITNAKEAFTQFAKSALNAVVSFVQEAIIKYAALAAAEAYTSQAGIPIIGPLLGAAAAMAAMGFVKGLISRMNKGGIVPGDRNGPNEDSHLALLTPGEIVLPRALSNHLLDVVGRPAGARANMGGVAQAGGGLNNGGNITVNMIEHNVRPRSPGQLDKFVQDQLVPSLTRLKKRGFGV